MKNRITVASLTVVTALFLLSACGNPAAHPSTADERHVVELKNQMDKAFNALERFSADNSLNYPDSLEALQPRYLESLPVDPLSQRALLYQKTENGFLLSTEADYSAQKAETGYPKMDQDGNFVHSHAEFPLAEKDRSAPTP